ncbi:hypothetical protein [Campylobacter hepaticus]|uniref:hypothetical protein n=1 Tax=Campylobacter hepaticus TaxID=1813019 RepID=UPI001627A61D|nr:hypothetical protein [Campylobacter hepaticus]
MENLNSYSIVANAYKNGNKTLLVSNGESIQYTIIDRIVVKEELFSKGFDCKQ